MAASFNDIINDIKKGTFSPVYLLMGEEAYYLDRIEEALEQSVVPEAERDFNQHIFYGAETDIETVISAARQFPFGSDRNLVVLKEAQAMQHPKIKLEKLAPYVASPSPSTVLAVVLKGDNLNATSELMKAAKSKAVVFKSAPLWEWQVKDPIRSYTASRRVSISDDAADMLVQYVGTDLSTLFGQIDRLILGMKPGENRITAELIQRNIGLSKEFNPFELNSALAVKDYAKAMLIVHQMSKNPKQHPAPVLTGALFNFFQKVALANLSPDTSDAAISKLTGTSGKLAMRDLRAAQRSYTGIKSFEAIRAIRDFDCRSKGIDSAQDTFELLKELVFRLFTI